MVHFAVTLKSIIYNLHEIMSHLYTFILTHTVLSYIGTYSEWVLAENHAFIKFVNGDGKSMHT